MIVRLITAVCFFAIALALQGDGGPFRAEKKITIPRPAAEDIKASDLIFDDANLFGDKWAGLVR